METRKLRLTKKEEKSDYDLLVNDHCLCPINKRIAIDNSKYFIGKLDEPMMKISILDFEKYPGIISSILCGREIEVNQENVLFIYHFAKKWQFADLLEQLISIFKLDDMIWQTIVDSNNALKQLIYVEDLVHDVNEDNFISTKIKICDLIDETTVFSIIKVFMSQIYYPRKQIIFDLIYEIDNEIGIINNLFLIHNDIPMKDIKKTWFRNFLDYLHMRRFNNSKSSINLCSKFFEQNQILNIIRLDEINSFIPFFQLNINANTILSFQTINDTFYKITDLEDFRLLEYVVFYSALKIFKYLILNSDVDIDSINLTIALYGGNAEIIHICEQKINQYEYNLYLPMKCPLNVIVCLHHRADLYRWIMEKFESCKSIVLLLSEITEELFEFGNYQMINDFLNLGIYTLKSCLTHSIKNYMLDITEWIVEINGSLTSQIDYVLIESVSIISPKFIRYLGKEELISINLAVRANDIKTLEDSQKYTLHDEIQALVYKFKKPEVIMYLQTKYKIDFNAILIGNFTPLLYAVSFENVEMTRFLLNQKSVDVNLCPQNLMKNAFIIAMERKNLKIAKMIVFNSFFIPEEIISSSGENFTPLHLACKSGMIDIVKELIKKGGDINAISV